MQTLPHGNGWDDSYVYLDAANGFISHPTQLYDSANAQLTRAWAQKAFLYPPSGLIPFLPLVPVVRAFGIQSAAGIWSLLDTGALIAALILVGRRARLGALSLGAMLLLISLTQPVAWEIGSGQINGVIVLLMVLACRESRGLSSGIFMGLSVALKPVAAIALLVPVLRRQPAVAAAAMCTICVLNAPFVLPLGVGSLLHYLTVILPFMLTFAIHDAWNLSPSSVVQSCCGGALPLRESVTSALGRWSLMPILILWSTRAVVIFIWLRAALDRRCSRGDALIVSTATVPLLAATVWPHYLIYTLPLAITLLAVPTARTRATATVCLVAMLWRGPAPGLWFSLLFSLLGAWLLVPARPPRDEARVNPAAAATGI